MPTIGLLEGFTPSRMRVRPPVILGRDYDLVPVAPVSLHRRQPNYLRGVPASLAGDDPGSLSTTASISAGAGRAMDSIYSNARNAALAAGKSAAEADAAGKQAVAAYQAGIVMSANARIEKERAEAELRRLQAIKQVNQPVIETPKFQTLIDDYQGQHPQGSRGGSGSVVSTYTFKVEPDVEEKEVNTGIDTRGRSTGAFAESGAEAGADASAGKSGLALPLLAVAAYFMLK